MLDRIQSYTQGVTFEQFEADNLRFDSTLLNLITIGEAIKNIPDDILQQAPEIPWRDLETVLFTVTIACRKTLSGKSSKMI